MNLLTILQQWLDEVLRWLSSDDFNLDDINEKLEEFTSNATAIDVVSIVQTTKDDAETVAEKLVKTVTDCFSYLKGKFLEDSNVQEVIGKAEKLLSDASNASSVWDWIRLIGGLYGNERVTTNESS